MPIYGFPAGRILRGRRLGLPQRSSSTQSRAELPLVTGANCAAAAAMAECLGGGRFRRPALEVIDSRYADFKFDLARVVADNGSSARYVVGDPRAACRIRPRTLGVVVERMAKQLSFGAGAAVLGHPALSLAMLANLLALREEVIPAGTTCDRRYHRSGRGRRGIIFAARLPALGPCRFVHLKIAEFPTCQSQSAASKDASRSSRIAD